MNGSERRALAGVAIFAALTVVYAVHLVVFLRLHGGTPAWPDELAESGAHWTAWLAMLPILFAIARRVRATAAPFAILIHTASSIAIAVSQIALRTLLDCGLHHGLWSKAQLTDGFLALFGRTFFGGVITYWGVVLVREVLVRRREAIEAAAVRDRQLAQAQLAALQHRLQPHFLFNALNAISSLMHEDVAAANRMLVHLSQLLRAVLDDDHAPEITVEREEQLLRDYLAVEQARFADRLRLRVAIEPEVRHAMMPRFLLQPLVENSVRHGIGARREGGSIDVAVGGGDGRLQIVVRDDGAGIDASAAERGVGLANCRARLEQLYGRQQRFEIGPGSEGGAVARIEIPLRMAEAR